MKFNKDFFKTRKEDGRIIFSPQEGEGSFIVENIGGGRRVYGREISCFNLKACVRYFLSNFYFFRKMIAP